MAKEFREIFSFLGFTFLILMHTYTAAKHPACRYKPNQGYHVFKLRRRFFLSDD